MCTSSSSSSSSFYLPFVDWRERRKKRYFFLSPEFLKGLGEQRSSFFFLLRFLLLLFLITEEGKTCQFFCFIFPSFVLFLRGLERRMFLLGALFCLCVIASSVRRGVNKLFSASQLERKSDLQEAEEEAGCGWKK